MSRVFSLFLFSHYPNSHYKVQTTAFVWFTVVPVRQSLESFARGTLEVATMESVCLMCGSEGFPEWLVLCNKCKACALHRYCLEGPIILDEDFTWLCEDCEPKKPPSLESSAPPPCGTSHNQKLEKDTTPAYLKLKNHVKRAKKTYGSLKEILGR